MYSPSTSPSLPPPCPYHPQLHRRAFRHQPYHHPTQLQLINLVSVEKKPAIYTCNLISHPPIDSFFLTAKLFFIKHCLSCHPFYTSFYLSLYRSKVLHRPKTLPATASRCIRPRRTPDTTCTRIQNKTLGYIAKDNSYVASSRWWQVESNDG